PLSVQRPSSSPLFPYTTLFRSVLPGDRVDVVLIRSVPGPSGSKENISDVLLQHVKVLAVDQLANEQQEKPTVARAVTLEVETDQDRKSTRLNSSHGSTSYPVFC